MKKYLLIIILFLAKEATSQESIIIKEAKDSLINIQTRLGFAVPDIPAFKALGNDPSNILRPSAAKDLAMMFSNFKSGTSAIIPQNLSAEITPGLVVRPWYTLNDYQTKGGLRMWTKTRFSVGTNKDDKTNINSMAFGIRTTLVDKGDYRLDKRFLQDNIYSSQDNITGTLVKLQNQYLKDNNLTAEQWATLSNEERNKILKEVLKGQELVDKFDKKIDSSLEKFKKENWNAARLDFAYSILFQSPDTLVSNAKVNKHLFWLTWAFRPGHNNKSCQFIFGVNNSLFNTNNKFYNEFTGNFRFYLGKNRLKWFLEGQYQNIDDPTIARKETLYGQTGIEVAVFESIWLHFGTGVLNALGGNAKSQLRSNANLYFSFPENLKLF